MEEMESESIVSSQTLLPVSPNGESSYCPLSELDLGKQLEPYGSVLPHESRLLKVLPTGFPIFEPTQLQISDEAEEITCAEIETPAQELEATNKFLLNGERRVKAITGEFDLLRQHVEKYFIVMDREIRERQMEQDPIFRNATIWQKAEVNKGEALRQIVNLKELFRLSNFKEITAGGSLEDCKQLNFTPAVKILPPEVERLNLMMAMVKRQQLYGSCLSTTDQVMEEIRKSSKQQKRFLKILKDLSPVWKAQKIPYAAHVYEKGDDYPYRAEIRVELLAIPSSCWGYDRPRRWMLPHYLGVPSVFVGAVPSPPYLAWPPLPPVSPTAAASADVYFVSSRKVNQKKQMQGDTRQQQGTSAISDCDNVKAHHLSVQIQWKGDSSHCIEAGRELQVRIVPVSIVPIFKVESEMMIDSDITTASLNGQPVISGHLSSSSSTSSTLPPFSYCCLPKPSGCCPDWALESRELHQRLQTAQWRLVDRAIHLIFQSQAASLKDALDVAAYGNREGSQYAVNVLAHFEQYRTRIPIQLVRSIASRRTGSLKFESLEDDTVAAAYVEVDREVIVERWETYMTALSFRNIPIYAPTITSAADQSVTPLFKVDFEAWINYAPVSSLQQAEGAKNNIFQKKKEVNDVAGELPSSPTIDFLIAEFYRRIPILEALATCYLRHTFLCAWKEAVTEIPKNCFDLFPLSLPTTRNTAGSKLFVDFIDWLQTYVCARMLMKVPDAYLKNLYRQIKRKDSHQSQCKSEETNNVHQSVPDNVSPSI